MSSDIRPEEDDSSPSRRSLFDLLMRTEVDEELEARVREADDRTKSSAVLLTDPAWLFGYRWRQAVEIDRANGCGYYLAIRTIDELKEVARSHQSHKDSAEVLRDLDIPLRGHEVGVLFVWKDYITYLFLEANPLEEEDEDFPEDRRRRRLLSEYSLRHLLLDSKEPRIEASHQDTPRRVELKPPVVENSRQYEPMKGGSAPSGAAKPAKKAPAVDRQSWNTKDFVMKLRMTRMVLRVPPELQEELIDISERLFDETRLEYSYSAILRGLIALGLASLDGKPSLAHLFNGSRVMRGRRRGTRRK